MRLRRLLGLTLGVGVGWLLLAPTRVRPVAFAQGNGPASYGYITQVLPLNGDLILSSLYAGTLARVPVSQVWGTA